MEQITLKLETLRSILDRDSSQAASELHLQSFLDHLAKHTFRPLPSQFMRLSITAALGRWQNLKPIVADQLSKEIVGRWKVFDAQAEEDQVDQPTQDLKPSEADAPEKQTEAADSTPTMVPDPRPAVQAPRFSRAPRRDWFDCILDGVSALIKPIQALLN